MLRVLARSDDTKWFLLGVGPFQSGTVKNEVQTGASNPTALARSMPSRPSTYVADRPKPFVPPPGSPPTPTDGPSVYPASTYPNIYRQCCATTTPQCQGRLLDEAGG